MKFWKIILVLFFSLMAVLVILFVLPSKQTIEVIMPPFAAQEAVSPRTTISRVHIPITVAFDEIEQILEDSLPQKFEGSCKFSTSALTDEFMRYQITREPAQVFSESDSLEFRIPLNATVTAGGKFGVKVKPFGIKVADLTRDVRSTLDIKGTIHGRILDITLSKEIEAELQTSLDVDINEAKFRLAGVKISVRGLLEKQVNGELEKQLPKLERDLETRLSHVLRTEVIKAWEAMHVVREINGMGWICTIPQRLLFSLPTFEGSQVHLGIGVEAKSVVQLGKKEKPQLVSNPLPLIEEDDDLGEFNLEVPVITVNLQEVSKHASDKFRDRIEIQDGDVQIENIQLGSGSGVIYIGLQFNACDGWFRKAQGTIYLTACPIWDSNKMELSFRQLNLSCESESALVTAGVWLCDLLMNPLVMERIQSKLEKAYSDKRGELMAIINERIISYFPDYLDPSFMVEDIGITQLVLAPDRIYLLASARGKITLGLLLSKLDSNVGVARNPEIFK